MLSLDPTHPLLQPEVLVAEVALISAVLVAIVTSVGQALQRKHVADIDKKADTIVDQVKNSHSTNLREDLDEIRDLMTENFGRLFDELHLERRERIALGDRLERHIHQGETK